MSRENKKSITKKSLRRHLQKNYSFFILALCTVGAGSGLFYISHFPTTQRIATTEKSPLTQTDSVDLHIAQYSDTHITDQAIIADPTIAENFLVNDTTSLAASANLAQTQTSPTTPTFSQGQEYGTWLWTSPRDMSDTYIQSILSGAKANGINVIYVSIDTYLDAYDLPDGTAKNEKETIFENDLENFVTQAHTDGIAVDAEAGWRNWAEAGNTYKAFAIVDFVKQFNTTEPEKLLGFQYDVEPYLLPNYQTDQASVLKNYIALVDQTVSRLAGSDLQFSIVIPDFYDDVIKQTVPFSYDGQTTYTYNHLLSVLEKRPGSTIIIMAYRNFAQGTNSTIDISNTEMSEASVSGLHTRVIIAQETGDVQPAYITFNDTTKNYLDQQTLDIRTAYANYSDFGGIAIHYVNAYLGLK